VCSDMGNGGDQIGAVLSLEEVPAGVDRREALCTFVHVLILRTSDRIGIT
jgi:hypothetical protein